MEPHSQSELSSQSPKRKRSAAQRTADLVVIEAYLVKGKTQQEIADLLAENRPYRVTRQQIAYDIDSLKKAWLQQGTDSFALSQGTILRKLEAVEREAWERHEASKANGKGGNPAYLKQVLEVQDRRVRLLGLDAPSRSEISGPQGAPIVVESIAMETRLSPEEKDALFLRHVQRIQQSAVPKEAHPGDAS